MNKRGVLMIFNDSGIWIVAVLCYAIAIYAFTGKKPVHFWAGHKIRQYTIKNVKLYKTLNNWIVIQSGDTKFDMFAFPFDMDKTEQAFIYIKKAIQKNANK